MAYEHVAIYLNDHLAGSVVAIELLEHLETEHAGTDLERFAAALRADIVADRTELESLLKQLDISESPPRKAMAWLAEKMTQLKLRLDDPGGGTLRLFEALEAVQLGIDGKRALWRALAAAAEDTPGLRSLDYERLTQRAEEQHRRVETVRLKAAKEALAPSP